MDLSQIRELLSVVAESDVEELTVEEEGLKVTVRKSTPTITMQSQGGYPGGYPQPAPAYPPYGGYPPPNAQWQPGAAPQGNGPAAHRAGPGETGTPPRPPQETVPAPEEAPAQEPASGGEAAPADRGTVVPAPIVGTFYRCPGPDEAPYVEVGDTVEKGDVLCIIEAMKLMNEIECETAGTVKDILVDDGEPVEYEQPLFIIDEG